MKVRLDINKDYDEVCINVCAPKDTEEIRDIYNRIKNIFEESFIVHDGKEAITVNVSDIIRIYGANKQVYIHTDQGQFRINERLYEMEERLDKRCFVRISNSEIVNIGRLRRMDTSLAGTIKMYLDEGTETYVSRRYVPVIKKTLGI